MSNMRVVFDNAASRATLTASSTAGALAASNLQGDDKSNVWRAVGTAAYLALSWPTAEDVGCLAAPVCNFSPTTTWRVRATNEQPAVNLLVSSNSMTTWGGTGTTKTNNVIAAPDGTVTAGLMANDTTTAGHYADRSIALPSGPYVNGDYYTTSVFVKAKGVTLLRLNHYYATGGSVGKYAQFDLATGKVTGSNSSAATILALWDGWFRISITNVVDSAATEPNRLLTRISMSGSNATWTVSYTGDVNLGLYVWGGQFEKGQVVTSFYASAGTAATRPLGYMDAWQSYDYDSGTVQACPAPALRPRGWTAAQAASAYAYGGGACARHWFPQMKAVGMRVDISDPDNLQGYLEAACLVAGPAWSPQYNASEASLTLIDTTELYRTAAGSQGADAGFIYRRLPIDLPLMLAADRAAFVNIVRNSRAYPILVSVFPESDDLALERDCTIYGRRTKDSDVAIQYAQAYSTTIEIEEI
jgi:hypothetical protein